MEVQPAAAGLERLETLHRSISSLEATVSQVRPSAPSAWVAQMVEHTTENRGVGGSIPPPGTKCTSSQGGSIEPSWRAVEKW